MEQVFLLHPPARDYSLTDQGRNGSEGVLDDAHAADADLQFVQDAGGGQDAVEGPQGRSRELFLQELARIAADAAQELLERVVVKRFFLELAMLLDKVV